MREIKCELSVKSINDAIKEIKEYKAKVNKDIKSIPKLLAKVGLDKLNTEISSISDTDGNDLGNASIEYGDNYSRIYHIGKQVYFLEFGTGYIGKDNPHVKSYLMKKGYATGQMIGENGLWSYYNKNGELISTQGIPAQMQVYETAVHIKYVCNDIIKELISK
ncbi:MAG: hypothetical protein RR708_04375 [Bacilli bacterium]